MAGPTLPRRRFGQAGIVLWLAFMIALAVLPVPVFWITLANYIGMYSLVALGLVLLTGIAGMMSFGQAAFVGLGAYASAVLTTSYGASPWIGLLAGVAVTVLAALALGALTVRLSGHYLPLCTLAWGLSLFYLFGNLTLLGQFDGITGIPPINVFGFELRSGRHIYLLIWLMVALAVMATLNLLDSRSGRAIRALKGGVVMAESCGVNTARTKMLAFVIAAVLAGLSGWLYAHLQRAVNPTPFDLSAGIGYLFMAVVGGAGYVWGALVGAALMTLLSDWLQSVLPALLGQSGNYEVVVTGLLMILLLQRAPAGIWPLLVRAVQWPFRRRMGSTAAPAELAPPAGLRAIGQARALPQRAKPAHGSPVLEVRLARKNVRRPGGRQRRELFAGRGRDRRTDRAQRCRQKYHVQPGQRRAAPERGRSALHGPARRWPALALDGPGRHGAYLPARAADARHERASRTSPSVPICAATRARWLAQLRLNRAEEASLFAQARTQLERVGLGGDGLREAGSLALGQQRLLEIARALACDPVLLLLDEPAAGLRHQEKQALATVLRQLRAKVSASCWSNTTWIS